MDKKIEYDWQNAFPQLVKYSDNKFYKILGSLLIGIELIKIPMVNKYSPHFVAYSLLGNKSGFDLKSCLSIPILLKPFYDIRGKEIYLSYIDHKSKFSEVIEIIKIQLPFSIDGDVSISELLTSIDNYSKTPPLSAAPNSYLQASLFESKLEIAICSGSEKQVQDIINQIKKRCWDLDHFALWGVKLEEWLMSVESKITSKNELISILNTNKIDKKLKKLQRSELIPHLSQA